MGDLPLEICLSNEKGRSSKTKKYLGSQKWMLCSFFCSRWSVTEDMFYNVCWCKAANTCFLRGISFTLILCHLGKRLTKPFSLLLCLHCLLGIIIAKMTPDCKLRLDLNYKYLMRIPASQSWQILDPVTFPYVL